MTNDLISRESLLNEFDTKCQSVCPTCEYNKWNSMLKRYECELINTAPPVRLDESVIQEVLNKRCMTAVANDYLKALHGSRPQGEWVCITKGNLGINTYKCSVCGHLITTTEGAMKQHYKGCYCGADMRSEEGGKKNEPK